VVALAFLSFVALAFLFVVAFVFLSVIPSRNLPLHFEPTQPA